ncbi:MAG: hypothetical protein KAI35_02170, partial [Desulfobulbaceae bacterium]|nr:hypothetical protein [Desulfobulbaceae bacterium]
TSCELQVDIDIFLTIQGVTPFDGRLIDFLSGFKGISRNLQLVTGNVCPHMSKLRMTSHA